MPRPLGVACLLWIVFFRTASVIAQSLPPEEYESLHKHFLNSLRPGLLQDLKAVTNNIGHGFALVSSIENETVKRIDRIVGRIDILFERAGELVESNFCTATSIRDLLVTARHCIPGPPPKKAVRIKFTTKYYYDGQPLDDRMELVLNDSNVRALDLDFSATVSDKQLVRDGPPLFYRAPIQDETVLLVSHPLGQGKRLSVGRCKVLIVNPLPLTTFIHTCATLEGSSGALLFAKSDGAILGMHVQGFETGTAINILNIVSRSPELSARIRQAAPPRGLDTSGWPLNEDDFLTYIGTAIRSGSPATVFDSILRESNVSNGIAGRSLYRVGVYAGSLPALDYLRALSITLAPGDRRAAVHDAIGAIDKGLADGSLLRRVFEDGGQISPDQNGTMPECGLHSQEVLAIMKERGRTC